MSIATAILGVAGVYLGVGLVFALWFVARGAGRLDSAARAGTPGFRALILPGACALWPVLLWKLALHRTAEPGGRP